MAALGVVAGHAAAAVWRLNREPIQKQGEDDSAVRAVSLSLRSELLSKYISLVCLYHYYLARKLWHCCATVKEAGASALRREK